MQNDRYLIYKVTIPRNYYNQEIEDKIKWFDEGYLQTSVTGFLNLKKDGYYKNPITITAVNNTYSIHPGSHRYVLNKVDPTMPELYGLVIDRYGTTKSMIEDTFQCEAKIYEKDFIGYFQYKNKVVNSHLTIGHGVKPFQGTNKMPGDPEYDYPNFHSFYNFYNNMLLGSTEKVRLLHNGKRILDLGIGEKVTAEKEVKDFSEFGKAVLEYFVDQDLL